MSTCSDSAATSPPNPTATPTPSASFDRSDATTPAATTDPPDLSSRAPVVVKSHSHDTREPPVTMAPPLEHEGLHGRGVGRVVEPSPDVTRRAGDRSGLVDPALAHERHIWNA